MRPIRSALLSTRLLALTGAMVLALTGAAVLTTASPASASCPQGHIVNNPATSRFIASGVNIRTGPGTNCTSVGQGQFGQTVTVHCATPSNSPADGHDWYHITNHATGRSGWVRNTFIEIVFLHRC